MTLAVLRLLGRASIALALGTLTPAACQPASAAEPAVTLHAGLIPEQLGKGTTIKFALTITPPAGQFPAALRTIDVRYPANLGLGTSNLGIDTCRAPILEAAGPPGCPADSVMGYGSGTVEVPFGSEILYEQVRVTAFMAPLRQGNIGLLLYADGESPVSAQLVFPATVLPATAPFGGDLTTMLPLISSVPEAPDVALLNLTMTLGPNHITYYEYARHKKIAYHPRGILLPAAAPDTDSSSLPNSPSTTAHTPALRRACRVLAVSVACPQLGVSSRSPTRPSSESTFAPTPARSVPADDRPSQARRRIASRARPPPSWRARERGPKREAIRPRPAHNSLSVSGCSRSITLWEPIYMLDRAAQRHLARPPRRREMARGTSPPIKWLPV